MSFSFYLNNIHFAIELMGAVVFLMAAWLSLDSYNLRQQFATIARAIGFGFGAIAHLVFALNVESDVLSYVSAILYLFGLLCIVGSFMKREELQVQAVIVLPAFALWSGYFATAEALLLFAVASLSFWQSRKEFNKTWLPFSAAFLVLSLGAVAGVLAKGDSAEVVSIAQYTLGLIGFALLVKWVWQFLQLRIRESLILIFIATALFLSTVVTLAFSTILMSQITAQTDANLRTDVRVLKLRVEGLMEESLAKTALIAESTALRDAIEQNDFPRLEELVEGLMEHYSLGFLTVVDAQGNVLMRAHALSRRGDSLIGERALEEALQGEPFVTIEESPVEKLSIRAAAPTLSEKGDKTIGVVIAGYPLDNALVDSIKRLTGLDMFVYTRDTATAATAFAADGRTRLVNISADAAVSAAVLEGGETLTIRTQLRDRAFRASYLPLENGDDRIIGMLSAAKPEQDILDIENSTNRLTLITVILIMLVLAAPIYMFTKRLTNELG